MITINRNIFNNYYRYNNIAFKAGKKQETQNINQASTINFFEDLLQKIDVKKVKSETQGIIDIINEMSDMENAKFARAPKNQAFNKKEITNDYVLSYSLDKTFRKTFDYRNKDYRYIHVNDDAILTYFAKESSSAKSSRSILIKGNEFKCVQKINDKNGDEISYVYKIGINDKKIKSLQIKGYTQMNDEFPIYAIVYFDDNAPVSMETVTLKDSSRQVDNKYYTIKDLKLTPVNI